MQSFFILGSTGVNLTILAHKAAYLLHCQAPRSGLYAPYRLRGGMSRAHCKCCVSVSKATLQRQL